MPGSYYDDTTPLGARTADTVGGFGLGRRPPAARAAGMPVDVTNQFLAAQQGGAPFPVGEAMQQGQPAGGGGGPGGFAGQFGRGAALPPAQAQPQGPPADLPPPGTVMPLAQAQPGHLPFMQAVPGGDGNTYVMVPRPPAQNWQNTPLAPGLPTMQDVASLFRTDMDRHQLAGPGGTPYMSAETMQRALPAYLQLLQGQSGARTQAGQLGLQQLQLLGVPGLLPGQMANDATRLQMAQEQHQDVLSRETRIGQAMAGYMASNPNVTQQEIAQYRHYLENFAFRPTTSNVPGAPGGGQGGPPGAPGQGGAAGGAGGGAPGGDIAAYQPPAAPSWTPVAGNLDQQWQNTLQRFGTGDARNRQVDPARADDAIADFVSGLGEEFVNHNIQHIMPYMIHRFGGGQMDRWFGARGGNLLGQPTASDRARELIMRAANNRGADVGGNYLMTPNQNVFDWNPNASLTTNLGRNSTGAAYQAGSYLGRRAGQVWQNVFGQ